MSGRPPVPAKTRTEFLGSRRASAKPVPVALTRVSLLYREGQAHRRLLFGTPHHSELLEQQFGLTRSCAVFEAGQIFALDDWQGKTVIIRGKAQVRTRARHAFILQAGAPGQALERVAGITPGAVVLVHAQGVLRCQALCEWIAKLKTETDPATLPPAFFQARDLWLSGTNPNRFALESLGMPSHAIG